ncbi:POX domain - like 10 [Theobroma cacao]|uniref:BEL1 homeodomain 1, putative n=1 Tax=Theobroma cacao TaxID=3641 RepID=A0A061GTY0_THECC|nr:BEL1 homeodomain 1, putative [Theobroma cacao]WRX33355.1 POX domain - like 9 [Theobroma cacao]WRX34232.1 POX domain - like 10 [Theobroma cacao]WRX35035.1 POX domain - like 10 [Theobroma cacao]
MATYFHGSSEFQAASAAAPDGTMQTLYLMNPNYVPYSDTHQPAAATNMFFLNPAGNALNPTSLHHAPPPNHHHLLGLPLPTPAASIGPGSSDDPHRPSLHGIVSGVHYNLWGPNIDHQNSPGSSHAQVVSAAAAAAANSGGAHDVASQLGLRRPVASPRQGLSLSLSSQQQVTYRSSNVETDIQGQSQVPTISLADDMRISGNSPSSVSVVSNGISGVQSVVLGSKYLRAAQELLDEVVNVGKGIKTDVSEGTKEKIKMNKESIAAVTGEGSSAGENGAKRGAELTTAQRQELQMKKAKLVSMLDEVEQRYRQYHHQMQIVVSSFEQAAGFGAARSYTALALQTISKQFRCLKDAISGQIKATSKSLGEEDCLGAKVEGSRLRFVDHQLRQQRALQQLGMMQHNAWRPQRGLPERAVSVLRAWLFEHFLHPYPKDSDKHMLAKQTGLTRSQVSNWFINARVRLWKPMVEEMYLEEVKERERNGSEENGNKSEQKESGSSSSAQQESAALKMDQVKTQSKPDKSINQNTSPTEFSNSTISTSPMGGSLLPQTAFNLIGSSDLDGTAARRSPKKPRGINDMHNSPSSILSMDMDMKQGETREINIKFGEERLSKDSYSLLTGTANHGGGFGTYSTMGEIGRFDPEQLTPRFPGNSVSLTLGLPHCDNLSLSGNQQNFLSNQNIQLGRRLELGPSESDFCGINNQQASHSSTGYENIEMQNRKRFAAQLLPDFVA